MVACPKFDAKPSKKARRRAKFDHLLSNPSATKTGGVQSRLLELKEISRVLTAYVPGVVTDTLIITHQTRQGSKSKSRG